MTLVFDWDYTGTVQVSELQHRRSDSYEELANLFTRLFEAEGNCRHMQVTKGLTK